MSLYRSEVQYMNKPRFTLHLLDMMDTRNQHLIRKLPPAPANPLTWVSKDALLNTSARPSKSKLYNQALVRYTTSSRAVRRNYP